MQTPGSGVSGMEVIGLLLVKGLCSPKHGSRSLRHGLGGGGEWQKEAFPPATHSKIHNIFEIQYYLPQLDKFTFLSRFFWVCFFEKGRERGQAPWSTAASFHARLWASWMPVFWPNPPAGGKRCAASPARNTRPPTCMAAATCAPPRPPRRHPPQWQSDWEAATAVPSHLQGLATRSENLAWCRGWRSWHSRPALVMTWPHWCAVCQTRPWECGNTCAPTGKHTHECRVMPGCSPSHRSAGCKGCTAWGRKGGGGRTKAAPRRS